MKTYITKTEQGWILCSDEVDDANFYYSKKDKKVYLWEYQQTIPLAGESNLVIIASETGRLPGQTPLINNLSVEHQKTTGWWNVYSILRSKDAEHTAELDWSDVKYGFNLAIELMAQTYTEAQLFRALWKGYDIAMNRSLEASAADRIKQYIQSLTPTMWEVEAEETEQGWVIKELKEETK